MKSPFRLCCLKFSNHCFAQKKLSCFARSAVRDSFALARKSALRAAKSASLVYANSKASSSSCACSALAMLIICKACNLRTAEADRGLQEKNFLAIRGPCFS